MPASSASPPAAASGPSPSSGGRPSSASAAPLDASSPVLERFVHLWGEMGSAWGINRTMAQLHALLYATDGPLDTDALMERLGISRGNANMNLRSLVAWGLVRKETRDGSRKDYFAAEKDVWAITRRIVEQRRRRELSPVLGEIEALRSDLVAGLDGGADALSDDDRALHRALDDLASFLRTFDGFASALIPFLDARHADLAKTLVALATQMRPPADPAP